MNVPPIFQCQSVRRTFGSGFSLDLPEFSILPGEVLGLLGPTGAGKSTLLRLLAGLERPDRGETRFAGHRLIPGQMALADRRRIAMVHQRPLLLNGSVRFNVEFGLRLRGLSPATARVEQVLDQLRLSPIASQSAQTLSGGQIQLVALARSLVIAPDVLLLDEPTAHLDPAHVALAERTIQTAQREQGMTIVWATHHLFQARRVAARTGLMLNGQLIEAADTATFFESPADSRTADFLHGRMIY